ncbi:MAG: glycoside hydrolase family 16 protein [Clostridia bacterium]|nr:glycoside hydrolase family 16 protein [Clostridia bacterium]
MYRKSMALLLALIMLVGSPLGASAEDSVPEKEGYVLDFSTEFNYGDLDTEYWLPQYLPHCTANTAGSSARYKVENGYLNLYITKDSPDYFGGQPGSVDPDNLLWIANGIQTWEKNHLHPGGAQQMQVEPYEGYATQYGYFEIRMKMPDTGGGGYASWWLIGTQDDAHSDGTMSKQNGEIDVLETFFKSPGVFEPKVHAWDDPDLDEWASKVELDGDPSDYINEFHTYAMDWRPEGITFYVDGKEVAQTKESPQYRMCMILSMYINSDFSGWDEPENEYPIEWLIDYVRVYKDKNGYDENNRLTEFERFIKELSDSLCVFMQRVLSFFQNLCTQCHQFFERLLSMIPVLYSPSNSYLLS